MGDILARHVVVAAVDRSAIGRACISAGFDDEQGYRVSVFDEIATIPAHFKPDVILLQHQHQGENIPTDMVADLEQAAARWPETPVLVVASPGTTEQERTAHEGGCAGYLTSETSVDCLVAAVKLLAEGYKVLPKAAGLEWGGMGEAQMSSPDTRPAIPFAPLAASSVASDIDRLTLRQRDVLDLLSKGYSNKAIASNLQITESTVKVHLRSIMARMDVNTRAQILARLLTQRSSG